MHLKMHLRTFNVNYELTSKYNLLNNCKLWLFSPSFIGFTTEWCELECAAIILLLVIIMYYYYYYYDHHERHHYINNLCHNYTIQHKLKKRRSKVDRK